MKEKKVFKYNEDDILEFMTESLAAQLGFAEFSAKAIFMGEAGKDLRMVLVLGEAADETMEKVDTNALDIMIEYNGSYSCNKIKKNAVLLG